MQSIRPYDLIIFDVDGVLITGSNEGYFRCFHEALVGVGLHLPVEEERKWILDYWGLPHRPKLSKVLSDRPEMLEEACRLYEACLHSPLFLDQIQPADGFPDVLHDLHGHYKLAIASGMEANILRDILREYSVLDLFDTVVSGYELPDAEHQKPSPYMVKEIIRLLAVSPARTLYVGDDTTDVLMAENAGVTFVSVLTGNLDLERACELGVQLIIPSIRELPSVLSET